MGWGCKHHSLSKVVITSYHSPQNKAAKKLNWCLFGGHNFIVKKGGLSVKQESRMFLSGVGRVCGYCAIHIDCVSLCLFLRREIKTLEVLGSFINPS